MSILVTLVVILAYLIVGARYVMPFAKEYRAAERKRYPSLYRDDSSGIFTPSVLNRDAVWSGIGKALFWPYVLILRWITDRLVNNLTADERKAAELKEARLVIAEYEAEQLRGGIHR